MRSEDLVTSSNTKARLLWYGSAFSKDKAVVLVLMSIQLDAGIHPAYDGLAALPFYDEFDLSTVDILLITQ